MIYHVANPRRVGGIWNVRVNLPFGRRRSEDVIALPWTKEVVFVYRYGAESTIVPNGLVFLLNALRNLQEIWYHSCHPIRSKRAIKRLNAMTGCVNDASRAICRTLNACIPRAQCLYRDGTMCPLFIHARYE